MMDRAKATARGVLQHKVPYLGTLMVVKAATLAALELLPSTDLSQQLGLLCVFATVADIALRVLASTQTRLSVQKHGADIGLVCILLVEIVSCFQEQPPSVCRALQLILPFVVLTSIGGNFVRLASSASTSTAASSTEELETLPPNPE
mmetsp:Transcript_31254/g.57177  ORF Transcript_31254/g.57177 Transcript_31254/m.57177 type:complete len:148 (-) Transcript_31254:45-488(-)